MTRCPRLRLLIEREIISADISEARAKHRAVRQLLARMKAITTEALNLQKQRRKCP